MLAASAGFGGRERPGISRFIRGADCLEVNVDVSESFTYIARGAIYLVTDKLRDIRIKFGFVVEGRERNELCGNQNSRRLWVLHPSTQSSRPRCRVHRLTG